MTAPAPGDMGDRRSAGGPPWWLAAIAIGTLVIGVALVAAQSLGIGVAVGPPAVTVPPAGDAAQRTHDQVARTLEAAGFQVQDPQDPFRPGESPALVSVPRLVLQAVLPNSPQAGYVVIYELPSAGDADSVGRDFVSYLASGPGAIQYPRDAQFVIRRVGQTLVFFPWSPQVSPDPEVARLAATLSAVGDPVTTP